MGAMRIALIVLLATLRTSSGTSHRHQAKFLAREPTVKVIDSDAVPLTNEQRQDSVVRITDVSVQKVDDQTPEEQDDIKIEVIGMHTKMVIPGSAPPTMPPDAKEAEKAALKMFEDMFEAWGGKVPEVSSVKALGKEDRGRLVPFGRQEPKMCISVTVLVPEFTMKDSVTKIIEGRIYKAVEVVGNATQKATATVAATASAKQHAMVQAEATGRGSYNATATAHAEHTAYAEATDQVTASYQASATALAGSPVKENSDVITKAHIKIEAQATSVEKATASATRRANATRSASATVNEGVDVQLSQTGTGESDAEVSKTASATAEDTETVTKTMKVGSEGVGKLKKLFEASATAQSWVASKACISARKARSLLDSTAMQLHGIPFALAVYNKAHAVAFEKAKGKAAEMALDTAQGAAKRQVERELIAQIQSYAKEHSAELKDLAMEDAVKSTLGQKKQLEAAAMAEAYQLASEKVHQQAPLKATAEAKEEAIKAAKEEATRLATVEARKDASKSLEKKVLQKAMEDAKAKAKLSAEAKAQGLAKAEAEKIAKDLALSLAHKAAQAEAEEAAKVKATKSAEQQAVEKAKAMVTAGADSTEAHLSWGLGSGVLLRSNRIRTAEPMAPAVARFFIAAVVCASCSKVGHHKGFLATHDARPHRNTHIQQTQSSSTQAENVEVHLLRSDDSVEAEGASEHKSVRRTTQEHRQRHRRNANEPVAEITDLSLQHLEKGNKADGIDIDIVKINTNMLLPSTYSVSLVTTTQAPANDRGDCVCQQGNFLHWNTKECIPQKPWGFECGFFPRQQQNRVCQDGLTCRRLNATDSYESSGKYKGWTATSPATCEYCSKEDDCTTGMERHVADCVRSGDLKRMEEELEDEDAELEPWEDSEVFEAWGHKGAKLHDGDDKDLDSFGRQEPKMCVTVKVTVPALTMRDQSTRVLEAKLNTTLQVIANATQKADANASASGKSQRQAVAEVQAEANATYNATAYAEATYTAYAEATDKATATYKAVATAEAKEKAKGSTEVTAAARSNATGAATKIANATRSMKAKGEAGVLVKLKQTGHGKASAEAEERATVHLEDVERVTKNATVTVEGHGSLKKVFQATATAKAIVEAKACISARQARKMLGQQTMKESGMTFARAVYKKAEREAYAEAKDRATRTAVKMATEAAQKRIDTDIERQVKEFTEAHREELEKIALEDAVNSTDALKKSLQEDAMKEAMRKAVEKVKSEAPLEAQRKADAKAKKAAEDQATKLATEEAQEEAKEGLEKKAVIKAREEAQEKANAQAKAKAFASAKAEAEDAAKEQATKAAGEAAEILAEQKARKKAEEAAVKKAVERASQIASEVDGASHE